MKYRHHHLTGLGAKADAKNGSGARQKNKEKLAGKEKVLYLCKKLKSTLRIRLSIAPFKCGLFSC